MANHGTKLGVSTPTLVISAYVGVGSEFTREKVGDSGVDSVGGQVQAFFPLEISAPPP